MKIYRLLSPVLILCVLTVSCGKTGNPQCSADPGEDLESSLKEFENREKYSSLTAEILKRIPDDKIEMAVIDYINDEKIRGNHREEYRIIKRLGSGFRYIYITSDFESEVMSGGFIQYFINRPDVFAAELPEALHNIGAYRTEKIARDAISMYNRERKTDDAVKSDSSMETFISQEGERGLDRLDELFYKTGEDLSKLRIRYIRENTEQFITR